MGIFCTFGALSCNGINTSEINYTGNKYTDSTYYYNTRGICSVLCIL